MTTLKIEVEELCAKRRAKPVWVSAQWKETEEQPNEPKAREDVQSRLERSRRG